MELFIILEDLHFSYGGSAPNPTNVAMSLLERSPTFTVASHMQNENGRIENANDLLVQAFAQLVI